MQNKKDEIIGVITELLAVAVYIALTLAITAIIMVR